ncbi:hypothetical protein ILYODFUR_032868 [Ilyodon furcidens]|uniref:Secreted protein n=1 Tax=Ilyodon furcidens TaxID=33524 RepID=A0ABV0SR41_9TELE
MLFWFLLPTFVCFRFSVSVLPPVSVLPLFLFRTQQTELWLLRKTSTMFNFIFNSSVTFGFPAAEKRFRTFKVYLLVLRLMIRSSCNTKAAWNKNKKLTYKTAHPK